MNGSPREQSSERLDLGHESRVSQAVGWMRHRPGRKLKALEGKLAAAEMAETTGKT